MSFRARTALNGTEYARPIKENIQMWHPAKKLCNTRMYNQKFEVGWGQAGPSASQLVGNRRPPWHFDKPHTYTPQLACLA